MEYILRRLFASFAAGSLALAAVPASAHGLGDLIALRGDVSVAAQLQHCREMTGQDRIECEQKIQAKAEVHVGSGSRVGHHDDDDRDHPRSSSGSTVSADAKIAATQHLWDKMVQRLEHTFSMIGKTAKRLCNATNSEATAAKACVDTLKVSFKAKVEAMIDAAFAA